MNYAYNKLNVGQIATQVATEQANFTATQVATEVTNRVVTYLYNYTVESLEKDYSRRIDELYKTN